MITNDVQYITQIIRFDRYISSKINNVSKVFGRVKHVIYKTRMKATLIAYLSLCRPIFEHADIRELNMTKT